MIERDPNLVPLADAASFCGYSRKTLRQWLAKGAITRYEEPGGRIVVDLRELLPRPKPQQECTK